MDGVRAYWDGSVLFSKQGKRLRVPEYFTKEFPSIPLDGELWMGRASYDKLMVLLNSKDKEKEEWKSVGYYIFDLPASTAVGYEERLDQLQQITLPSHVHIVESTKCHSMEHLKQRLNEVLEGGGEGLVVHEPHSLYVPGFTSTLLKVKVFCIFMGTI